MALMALWVFDHQPRHLHVAVNVGRREASMSAASSIRPIAAPVSMSVCIAELTSRWVSSEIMPRQLQRTSFMPLRRSMRSILSRYPVQRFV